MLGQAYIDSRGKPRAERRVRPKDCSSCRKQCNVAFSDADRVKIHQSFWALADNEKQKLFISTLVEEGPKASTRTKKESRRSVTRQYFLRCGRTKVPVCQGFFLATLDVSEAVVKNILKNRDDTTYFPRESLQGKRTCPRARPEQVKELIRQHIRSYLPSPEEAAAAAAANGSGDTPSKKNNKKKKAAAAAAAAATSGDKMEYTLAAGLNVKRMWDSYVDVCQWSSTKPEKQWLYREILQKDFNIKFSDPTQKPPIQQQHQPQISKRSVKEEEEEEEEVEQQEVEQPQQQQTQQHEVQVQYPGTYPGGAQVGYAIHYGYP